LVIEAYSGNEVITLKVPVPNKVSQEDENSYVTYTLGTSTSKTAKYVLTDSDGTITFETGSELVMANNYKEYDAGINTVSGTFKFNAENSDNNLRRFCIEFSTRCLYKVPIREETL
jgi:hypothetical protein